MTQRWSTGKKEWPREYWKETVTWRIISGKKHWPGEYWREKVMRRVLERKSGSEGTGKKKWSREYWKEGGPERILKKKGSPWGVLQRKGGSGELLERKGMCPGEGVLERKGGPEGGDCGDAYPEGRGVRPNCHPPLMRIFLKHPLPTYTVYFWMFASRIFAECKSTKFMVPQSWP